MAPRLPVHTSKIGIKTKARQSGWPEFRIFQQTIHEVAGLALSEEDDDVRPRWAAYVDMLDRADTAMVKVDDKHACSKCAGAGLKCFAPARFFGRLKSELVGACASCSGFPDDCTLMPRARDGLARSAANTKTPEANAAQGSDGSWGIFDRDGMWPRFEHDLRQQREGLAAAFAEHGRAGAESYSNLVMLTWSGSEDGNDLFGEFSSDPEADGFDDDDGDSDDDAELFDSGMVDGEEGASAGLGLRGDYFEKGDRWMRLGDTYQAERGVSQRAAADHLSTFGMVDFKSLTGGERCEWCVTDGVEACRLIVMRGLHEDKRPIGVCGHCEKGGFHCSAFDPKAVTCDGPHSAFAYVVRRPPRTGPRPASPEVGAVFDSMNPGAGVPDGPPAPAAADTGRRTTPAARCGGGKKRKAADKEPADDLEAPAAGASKTTTKKKQAAPAARKALQPADGNAPKRRGRVLEWRKVA